MVYFRALKYKLRNNSEHNSDIDGANKSCTTPSLEVSQGSGLFRKLTSLSDDMVSSVPVGSDRYTLVTLLHSSALKFLSSSIALSLQNSLALDSGSNSVPIANSASSPAECEFDVNDQIPSFTHSFYSLLLVDLHEMFNNLPAIDKALVYARKMLADVEKGKEVHCEVLSHVNKFRIAVE